MRRLAVILLTLMPLFALAGDPGQPLDCSDWVFLEPGLTCEIAVLDCNAPDVEGEWCSPGSAVQTDTRGRLLLFRRVQRMYEECQSPGGVIVPARYHAELVARSNGEEQIVAYLSEKCGGVNQADTFDFGTTTEIHFDQFTGTLFLVIDPRCNANQQGSCAGYTSPADQPSLIAISGFQTAFDVTQEYEPPSGPISFKVPSMPEGLAAASYFDTYYGDLATVGDWSQAQPLQCGYPATLPEPGDYLTVNDPLPDPAPGHGRYYITAANYQGQRRYGRKSEGGVLSGRDPAVLPACE